MSGDEVPDDVRIRPSVPPRRTTVVVTRRNEVTRELDVGAALDLMLDIHDDVSATLRLWSEVTTLALEMIGRRRLIPTLTDDDVDAWRIGPFDHHDDARLDSLAQQLETDVHQVRQWMDAVADTLPRTAAASTMVGQCAFAARGESQSYPELRSWVEEASSALGSGIRVSLRVEPPRTDATIDVVVQVHSLRDPGVVEDMTTVWSDASTFDPAARVAVATMLHRAAHEWPPVHALLAKAVPDRVTIDSVELADLVTSAGARLAEIDVSVHLPAELATLTATVAARGRSSDSRDLGSVLNGDVGVEFDWRLALGDATLTPAEMDTLAEAHRPVVRLRDQWVVLTPDVAEKVRDPRVGPLTPIDALGAALTGTVQVGEHVVPILAPSWLDDLRDRITDPSRSAVVAVPSGLHATLRDYQQAGLRWLVQLTSLGLGGCLADDMGLGKTVTLIALHLHRAEEARAGRGPDGTTLVVCPASLLGTWEREITRFAPDVPVTRHHGDGRRLADDPEGFVLTTYGTMRRDAPTLAARRWGMVVADEAQHVKNPSAQAARVLRTIPAAARVALTGTPIENDLSELWAILDWTTPGLLGSLGQFRTRWATPIEADGDADAAAGLARLTAPFILRRRKSDPDIVPELPAKTETDQPVRLTREQTGLYEAVVRETMERIATADGMERRGLIMSMLTSLKQVCNHPAHYLREEDPLLPGRSGKLDLLDEIVDTVVAEDGAVIVFTQYVTMARLLERHLADRGVDTVFLHGGTPVEARQAMVDRFQTGAAPVFLASLRAAGTGLTLTRADHVVHYDRWWNPAVEDQATDRAYRIGQSRPVQVHRLLSIGTLEERIADLLAAKRGLADAILTSGETALTDLSDDELTDLVQLRGDR